MERPDRTATSPTRRRTRWAIAGVLAAFVLAGSHIAAIDVAWRVAVVVIGVVAGIVAWRRYEIPGLFAAVFAAMSVRLAAVESPRLPWTLPDLSWAQAVSDAFSGPALVLVVMLAVRARRTSFGVRESLDVTVVLLASAATAWMTLAMPSVRDGASLPLAVMSSIYVPVALILMTFVLEVMLDGLAANTAMRLLVASAVANFAGTTMRALVQVGVLGDWSYSLINATFVLGYLMLMDAACDPSASKILVPARHDDPLRFETARIAPLGLSLVAVAAASSAVATTSNTDRVVRTILLALVVASVLARLYVALASNVAYQRELVHRLDTDDLTGLPTRAPLIAMLDEALEQTWHDDTRPVLIQINLDRFKNLNDSLGHAAANRLLVMVSERLAGVAASFDGIVARTGGDDFVLLDPTPLGSSGVRERVARTSEVFERSFVLGDGAVFVTASIGVAVAPRARTLSGEELMRRADIATHRAKAAGRNQVVTYDDSMDTNLTRRMDVEHALHGAIGRQEMRLYHQPIVDLTTGRVTGFEALIRWRRNGTIISPADFIPVAEETGLINEIGAWALRTALADLRRWIDDGVVASDATTSVNVSPRQIADPNFADIVRDALDASGIPPHQLWLEMTESMMLQEPALARTTLGVVHSLGVRLALDDFGTGYSSLSLLLQFPIQRIKIDRAFVQGIPDRTHDRSLVRTIIAMGHSMDLDLVAEGVETVQQLHTLRELGCEKAQGYLISHPVPADAIRSTMSALAEQELMDLLHSAPSEELGPPESIARLSNVAMGVELLATRPLV